MILNDDLRSKVMDLDSIFSVPIEAYIPFTHVVCYILAASPLVSSGFSELSGVSGLHYEELFKIDCKFFW